MSNKKIIECIESIADSFGLSISDFKNYCEKKYSINITDYKPVYPENQNLIYSGDKVYVENLKVMLGQNLYKDSKMLKMNDKLSKMLNIEDPPINWYISEKWDGIRAIWDGEKFVSRGNASGNPKVYSFVPEYFVKLMPPGIALDGEIWIDRGQFSKASRLSTLKVGATYKTEKALTGVWTDKTYSVKYKVFDMPNSTETFEKRYNFLREIIKNRKELWDTNLKKNYNLEYLECPLQLTEQTQITSMEQLVTTYKNLTSLGAEGVMLRAPNSPYEQKRSKYLLKYKIKDDAEAIVKEYILGTGRLKGLLGSLKCELILDGKLTGVIFQVGSGFNDEQRKEYSNPKSSYFIPINSIISFSYMELSKDLVPRHPIYKGIREDVKLPETESDSKKENIDYRKYILKEFDDIIKNLQVDKEPNWQFKRKAYKQVYDILNATQEKINTTTDALRILREGGAKFNNEETYYAKNGEYKSSAIMKINYIIKTGIPNEDISESTDSSDPKIKAISELSSIAEIGPSTANKLYEKGITSIAELNIAVKNKTITLNNKQLIGLYHHDDLKERIPRSEMDKWNIIFTEHIKKTCKELKINIEDITYNIVGSYRRNQSSSGDIDLLLTSKLTKDINIQIFKTLINKLFESKYLDKDLIFSFGETKMMGLGLYDEYYRHVDIFFYSEKEYPFALLFTTGSAQFNVEMRAYVLKQGYSLNDKELLKYNESKKLIPVSEDEYLSKIGKKYPLSEEDIFDYLRLRYIKPSDRQSGMIIKI